MSTQLLLALQSLIVPLAMSFVIQRFSVGRTQYVDLAIFGAWLLSYLWIAGFPTIIPKEALDWMLPLGVVYLFIRRVKLLAPHSGVIDPLFVVMGITLLCWPVMRHQMSVALAVELGVFALIFALISMRLPRHMPASPALVLAICSGGLALLASLGGSLLIGQLSGALASVLGAFALYELRTKFETSLLRPETTFFLVLIFSWLLLIARVYAELPLPSIALIIFALFTGLNLKWRPAPAISLLAVVISLLWFYLTTDNSSYY